MASFCLGQPRFPATSCARRSPTTPAKPVEPKHFGVRWDCSCGETVASAALRRCQSGWILFGSCDRPQIVASVQGDHCEGYPCKNGLEAACLLHMTAGQPRENCDKTEVFTWNMGLVIPEVFIRINMSASQPETPENTISP
ncbi:hypothetical protein Bbelb_283840 [Branchiostoma belcheri]|nr:hypothetical protein Bbelb_283840 [Branchiostoma belcheri]